MLRKLGDRKLPVAVNDRRLWPGTAKGGTGREQQTKIIIAAAILADAQGGGQQGRQLDERRNMRAGRQKRTSFAFREAQSALARDIMSENVLSAPQETRIPDAIALMLREGRKRIVVLDEADRPVGIVDRQTLLAASLGD